jgi:hypothetical protein
MASGKGAATGALSGAAAGSAFGPWGAGIGGGLGALIGLFKGGDKPMSPELQRMYDLELSRFEQSNPLVEAAYRLAFNRLPTASREGLTEPSLAGANAQVPYPMSGDYNEPIGVRNALRSQEVRMRMADPIIQAVQRLAMNRMPRGYQWQKQPPLAGGTPPGRDENPGGGRPGRQV